MRSRSFITRACVVLMCIAGTASPSAAPAGEPPSPIGDAFFDKFQTFETYEQLLADIENTYPLLVTRFSIGTSVEGRELWMVRLTAPTDAPKSAVLFEAAMHGDEYAGPPAIMMTAKRLLEGYGSDAGLTALLDEIEIYLLPIANPDGYVIKERLSATEVDLNRDFFDHDPRVEVFTQPESIALRDFFHATDNLRGYVSLHAFQQDIIVPWSSISEAIPEEETFRSVGSRMADEIATVRGTVYSVSRVRFASAASIDYAYDAHGIWAISIAIGFDAFPNVGEIRPIAEEMHLAMLEVARFIHDCNSNDVSDIIEVATTEQDCNLNDTPDVCELPDTDDDGLLNVCDEDNDNALDLRDFAFFQTGFRIAP